MRDFVKYSTSEVREYATCLSEYKTYLPPVFVALLGAVAIFLIGSLILKFPGAVSAVSYLMRAVPLLLIAVGIGWRGLELALSRRIGDQWVLRLLENPIAVVALCLLSAFLCTWAVLAAQIGIITSSGIGELVGAIGGVLPLADAKQYLGAAFEMARQGNMGSYAARRPLHSILLSLFFVLSEGRLSILFIQAMLVGASLGYLCINLARFVGIAASIVVWGTVYLLSLDFLPTFMSESTGMWLGFLGLAITLSGFMRAAPIPLALGLGLIQLGETARPGAFLVVPAFALVGLWFFRGQLREALLFGLSFLVCLGVSFMVPVLAFALYRHGGMWMGNLSYILYQLSVGSSDWRQIELDFPHAYETLRGAELYDFIYNKAWEAFINSPLTLIKTYLYLAYSAVRDMPATLFQNFALALGFNAEQCQANAVCAPLFGNVGPAVLFFSGWVTLVAGSGWSRNWRLAVIIITLGYIASLPISWLGLSIRPQAATLPLLCLVGAGLLARPPKVGAALSRQSAGDVVGMAAYAVVILAIIVPRLAAATSNLRPPPPRPVVPTDATLKYLIFGPYTPVLRIVAGNGPTIRPDIPISEFEQVPRVKREPNYFQPTNIGDQIMIGFDARIPLDRVYWSKTFCIPDREWIFLATVVPRWPPYSYQIDSLVPVDRKGVPIPEGAPLPYNCLYGAEPAGFGKVPELKPPPRRRSFWDWL